MISLGGIALPDGQAQDCDPQLGRIEWSDQYAWQPMASRVQRTIGGRIHYAQAQLTQGQPITLEAREGVCWLLQSHRDALVALASAPGIHAFIYETFTADVVFDMESGGVELARKRVNRDTYWLGTIRLISVG